MRCLPPSQIEDQVSPGQWVVVASSLSRHLRIYPLALLQDTCSTLPCCWVASRKIKSRKTQSRNKHHLHKSHLRVKLVFSQLIKAISVYWMIGSCVAWVCRFMDTCGRFGEHVRSVRLTQGVAESSSCFSPSFPSTFITRYTHNLKHSPILLEHSMQTQVTHEQRVYYNCVAFTR